MTAGLLDLLGPAERDLLLEGSTRTVYAAGETRPFAPTPRLALIVESGLVRLYVESPAARQTTIDYLAPGDTYAILDALGPPEPMHLQAILTSTLIMLDAPDVDRLTTSNLGVATAAVRVLGDVASHRAHTIALRSLGSMTERLAYDLLERAADEQLRSGRLIFNVTHQELADAIGSTREVVTRIVGRLRREGVLKSVPGGIEVTDAARLASLVRRVMMAG